MVKFNNGKTIFVVYIDIRAKCPRVKTMTIKTMIKLLNREAKSSWLGLIRDTDSMQIGLLAITGGTDNPFESVLEPYHSVL